MAGKRVYISFAAEDAAQCNLLTAALDAWEVTYITTRPALPQGDQLPEVEKAAIRGCEVFLRLCTDATKRSVPMHQDLLFFDTLQAEDRSKHQREQRALVNLIMDATYIREPFDNVTLFIDTANKSRAFWLDELARPLGVATQARRLSRRSALALGVAGAVTLVSGGTAATLFVQNASAANAAHASNKPVPLSNKTSGQAKWVRDLSSYSAAKTGDLGQPASNIVVNVAAGASIVFAAIWNDLLALDMNDGHVIWEFHDFQATGKPFQSIDVGLSALDSAILYADKNVIVLRINENTTQDTNSATSYITVFDAHHQKVISRLAQVDRAGSVTVIGDTIYGIAGVGNADGTATRRAYAFDLHSGRVIWNTDPLAVAPGAGLAYANDRLYFGIAYRFLCLNAQGGKSIWEFPFAGTATSTPTVANGTIYFGTIDGYLYALDAQTGKVQWRFQTQHPIEAQPLVADGVVYVGDDSGYLWAFVAATGKLYWSVFAGEVAGDVQSQTPGDSNIAIQTQPAIYKNLVAVVVDNVLAAINVLSATSNKRQWLPYQVSTNIDGAPITGPLVMNGLFIVGNDSAQVTAINP